MIPCFIRQVTLVSKIAREEPGDSRKKYEGVLDLKATVHEWATNTIQCEELHPGDLGSGMYVGYII